MKIYKMKLINDTLVAYEVMDKMPNKINNEFIYATEKELEKVKNVDYSRLL